MYQFRSHSTARLFAFAAMLAMGSAALGQSESGDYPSPPLNPDVAEAEVNRTESVYRGAKGRLDHAVRGVRDAEAKARQAADRLRRAHGSIDDYLANKAPSDAGRQAVVAIEEARQDANRIRDRALAPLSKDPIYRKMHRALETARQQFEKLEEKRVRADFLGRRMAKQDREDIVYLADKIFELETEVFARELDVLDDHAAYQAATERLGETKKVARSTMSWLRDLEKSDPHRKALADSIRAATKAARDADLALERARKSRAGAKRSLASAAQQRDEARRVKQYADRGLAPPRRGQ